MPTTSRKAIDARAMSLMVGLCFLWGFSHVAAKLAAPGISLVMQGGIRSILAACALFTWASLRGIPLFARDGTLWHGLAAGALFAGEFLFLFLGLAHTTASRMVVFLYLAPCLTALGLHWFVASERLRWVQWIGILVAFAGVVLAFGDGFLSARGTLLGDVFGVIAAVMWGATTVLIRSTRLATCSPAKTLFYQLAVSAVALLNASHLLAEPGVIAWSPIVIASLAYQGLVVAFASYLAWFWLLTRYRATPLAVFGFLAPMFGVVAGVVVLSEPISITFVGAVILVGAGIYLVNSTGG